MPSTSTPTPRPALPRLAHGLAHAGEPAPVELDDVLCEGGDVIEPALDRPVEAWTKCAEIATEMSWRPTLIGPEDSCMQGNACDSVLQARRAG